MVVATNATLVAMRCGRTHTVGVPGGRLTPTDRQRIADGLSSGLGYAEIARRLAGPTPPTRREAAGNPAPPGSRADLAVRATPHGARGRKPVTRTQSTIPS